MTAETVFAICNTLVLPQWLLLLVAPRWHWTQKLRDSYAIPLLLVLVYACLVITFIGSAQNGGFSTLEQVKNLFANDYLLLAGWIHYLAFDLFVGSWIARNAQKSEVHHLLVIPCLVGTFMLGPVGFLLYQIVKKFASNTPLTYETA